jgi:hypothetical protein
MLDIYDGPDWTEMDIEDLKAAIESGSSIKTQPKCCAAPAASRTLLARLKN